MSAFIGEVHPLADAWPMLDGDELDALAESIREHGLREPLVTDHQGRLIDGRNRLAACRLADVMPSYVTLREVRTEEEIAAYIQDRNAERRHLSAGQQAMGRALMLQAQGKRRNGRWERGSVTNVTDGSDGERVLMVKAGLILDTAARAAALGPDFHEYTLLPGQVMNRESTLDFAYRQAQAFEGKAALAEAMKTQPLTEVLLRIEVLLDDAESIFPLPVLAVPLTKEHRHRLAESAKRARALAASLTTYSKDQK